MKPRRLIHTKKTVQKASEAVWAANKYFVLACSQQDLLSAYQQLHETEITHQTIASRDLPELSNALCHVLGYFKQELSQQDRQRINDQIKTEPEKALQALETLTFKHRKSYLMPCRLWQRDRFFNEVPVAMMFEGHHFEAYTWRWCGDYYTDSQ